MSEMELLSTRATAKPERLIVPAEFRPEVLHLVILNPTFYYACLARLIIAEIKFRHRRSTRGTAKP